MRVMNRIRFVSVGSSKDDYVKRGIDKYLRKLRAYVRVEYEEVKPVDYGSGTIEEVRRHETRFILDHLDLGEPNLFLDQRGEQRSSEELAHWMKDRFQDESRRINFITGGAYGIDLSLLPPGSHVLSLSLMTFHHRLVVIILLEQVYRAFTIINGESYHQAQRTIPNCTSLV